MLKFIIPILMSMTLSVSAESIDKEPVRDFIVKQEERIKIGRQSRRYWKDVLDDGLYAIREILLKILEIENAKLEHMKERKHETN